MATIKDIDRVLSSVAPKELSESWDNDGVMICSDACRNVNKVLVSLDATEDAVDFAVANGFELIVTHHPFIFKPLARITDNDYRVISKLVKSEISVISYHTRMDSAETGVNFCNAELLELENICGFGGESGMLGKIGTLKTPLSPDDFGVYLKNKLGCGNIRASFFRNIDRKINKVAVIGGAGKGFIYEAYKAGADAFVTSEAAHNTFMDCTELGMCIYDCGHYYTENAVCKRFKEIINDAFGETVFVELYDTGSPYINI